MEKMRLGTALAFLTLLVCPLLLECATTTYQMVKQSDKPAFQLSVNLSSKVINVTMEPGERKVWTRWCHKKGNSCMGGPDSPPVMIDPSQSRSTVLNMSYLLPCLCVQVYYTHRDTSRHIKCLFENEELTDVRDVWASSELRANPSSIHWSSLCSVIYQKISASLCWKQYEHLCTPVLNSTLNGNDDGKALTYDTSVVDRHPQMCVELSLQGSHHLYCPFKADESSWEVYIELDKQSVSAYLTSSVPATFSAQLCLLNERGCTPTAQVYSVRMKGNTSDSTRLSVPLPFTAEKPCVQVWQSDPARHGTRILCPDYKHYRHGMYAVACLCFVVFVAFLGIFIRRLTKSGATGWLYIQKPVLLVCSSEQSAHVSAVCALASILQEELSATVHMALCAQSKGILGAGTGVADLGPLPWLYGHWEVMRKAQGKVLIIWSPEAKQTYEKWKEERSNTGKNERKKEEDSKAKVREEVEEQTDCDWYSQNKPSAVIGPVFTATLACLEGTLQECKDQGVALVYFQGLGHNKDIPKAFRGVSRYCLPQDFRGLIQELGGMTRQTTTGQFMWHCWPRLLSKVMSVRLARQLAHRLQTLLPQVQGKKKQELSVTSTQTVMSGSVQEHEPLHGSLWRAEELESQIS
ncbi:interleukin-17 receptor E [Scomber japonicus]|uniref:interleukin-17 receptor E n=1 Tax=Scomber japonicus TaxID=13676 RepID=UPI002305A8CA|nr:interleukin-17 receptor E [Scomber japonicus]